VRAWSRSGAAAAIGALLLLPACSASDSPASSSATAVVATTSPTTRAPVTEPVTQPVTMPVTAPPSTEPPTTTAPTTTVPPGPTTLPPPGATRVLVINAGVADGGATAASEGLRAIGYQVLAPQNGLEDRDRSVVFFREGWEEAARQVATRSGISQEQVTLLPDSPLTDPQPAGVDVVLLLGRDRR
jgi:hypothetical protein